MSDKLFSLVGPNKVKKLASKLNSITNFTVVWDPPEGRASTYRVLVEDGSGLVNDVIVDESKYTAINLEPGSVYNITVWAQVNTSVEGESVSIQGSTSKSFYRQVVTTNKMIKY